MHNYAQGCNWRKYAEDNWKFSNLPIIEIFAGKHALTQDTETEK